MQLETSLAILVKTGIPVEVVKLLIAGKVAGAKWEGSKTVFDDAASNGDTVTDAIHSPGHAQSSAGADPPSFTDILLPDIKWKKLATAELSKVHSSLGKQQHMSPAAELRVCCNTLYLWSSNALLFAGDIVDPVCY